MRFAPSLEKLRERRPPPEEPNRANRPSLEKLVRGARHLKGRIRERRLPLKESYREIDPSFEKLPRERRPPL